MFKILILVQFFYNYDKVQKHKNETPEFIFFSLEKGHKKLIVSTA